MKKEYEKDYSLQKIDRAKLMDISSGLVEQLWARLNVKRFKAQGSDNVRLQYIRATVQALQAHNSILKEQELEDIKDRLENLEEMNRS